MADVNWGLLPHNITAQLTQREWLNRTHLKARLKGERAFPLEISLKAPTNAQVLENPEHFQSFIHAWQNSPPNFNVQWQTRQLRHFGQQNIPIKIQINTLPDLIACLGENEQQAFARIYEKFAFLLQNLTAHLDFINVLIDNLELIEPLADVQLQLLVQLIPQLQANMGQGNYLRALPLVGVDTKFLESHFVLVENLLDALHNGQVKTQGLMAWLNCKPKPKDWLLIKPLCNKAQQALGGLPILRLDSETLLNFALPAQNILIVENEQSALALPNLDNSIVVAGGGKNVAWLDATWLADKNLAYWGDIDSDGLHILNLARLKQPSIRALMMDEQTLIQHQKQMVNEAKACEFVPAGLTVAEVGLYQKLKNGEFGCTRLEQERLARDYVATILAKWLAH
ncbi:DUF3322 domain-containing protein [Lonepinella sp. BR2271]|uniref:DUF3322 domain-containing protein n=1 Tax=Lonepinella sp. BR2271 TaxID=3434550 RepID=UPI003F6E1B11